MMKLELTEDEVMKLMTVLGAAKGAFIELASDPKLKGVFLEFVNQQDEAAGYFIEKIAAVHNEMHPARPRIG